MADQGLLSSLLLHALAGDGHHVQQALSSNGLGSALNASHPRVGGLLHALLLSLVAVQASDITHGVNWAEKPTVYLVEARQQVSKPVIDAISHLVHLAPQIATRAGPKGVRPLHLAVLSGDPKVVAAVLKGERDRSPKTQTVPLP